MPSLRFPVGMVLSGLAVLGLAGCSTRSGKLQYNPTNFTAPDPLPAAATNASYRLTPGDVINVRVYELETISGDQSIDDTGRVNMPLVGPVPADGKTTDEFGAELSRMLQVKYLQSPHVVVTLKSAKMRVLTVDGSVDAPGVYPVVPGTTLIQTIAMAKGPSSHANIKRVVIFRNIGGQRRAAGFDLTTIRNGTDADPQVYPNDVIVVDGSDLASGYRTLLRSIPLAGFFLGL